MKRKNFPHRLLARRKSALERRAHDVEFWGNELSLAQRNPMEDEKAQKKLVKQLTHKLQTAKQDVKTLKSRVGDS
jgi:uncharacterized protein YggU (UPF0235/DUF167 family)